MIDFYTWSTPNGRKISIMLEELGIDYEVHAVNITKGEQHDPEFVKISPNSKIPAITDRETGLTLMESGAILMYLAEKTGMFWPTDFEPRWRTVEWLMWQMGGPGPIFGRIHSFVKFNPGKAPYAEEVFLKEGRRLYGILDQRLGEVDYVAGEYSIADMALWPWVSRFEWQTIDMNDYPNVVRWYKAIAERPAVQRGYHVPVEQPGIPMP